MKVYRTNGDTILYAKAGYILVTPEGTLKLSVSEKGPFIVCFPKGEWTRVECPQNL